MNELHLTAILIICMTIICMIIIMGYPKCKSARWDREPRKKRK